MTQQPPHVAIVGAGIFVRNTYIPRLAEISNLVVLRAIWSRSEESARGAVEIAKKFFPNVECKWGDTGLSEIIDNASIIGVAVVLAGQTQKSRINPVFDDKMSNSESQALRKDPAWNYATLEDPKNTNKVKCNFCGKTTNGGIYRHKQHLIGGNRNTKTCSKCPKHVKEEISSYMSKKKELKNQMDAIPHFDEVAEQQEYLEVEEDIRAKGKRPQSVSFGQRSNLAPDFSGKKLKQTGPIDLYFRQDVDEIVSQGKKKDAKTAKLYDENKKKLRENAVQKFARWMYDAGIPFNAVNYDSFKPFIEAVGQFGCGMKPPTYHEVRVTCLKKELEHTKLLLKDYTDDHVKYGCTLMADGWTDRKNRTLINFLVNGPRGTVFIESVDGSSYSHTGAKLFDLFDKYVQQIGAKNVVQIVTDSASANVLAGRHLEAQYPHLYWSPCAAHCLDLMLEDFFKLPHLKKVYERAMMVNGYIYNRPQVLNMMREFTRQKDMVRAGKTRFATAFLTLKRFQNHKASLRKMFTSEKWTTSRFAKEAPGKRASEVILMPSFWNTVVYAVKVGGPVVKVLRLVDGEKKPPMGYIYEAMDLAKEAIAASFDHKEDKYKEIFAIIDHRWTIQLHRPLHAAGHFLNPEFFYSDSNIENGNEVVTGLYKCIAKMCETDELQDKIMDQLPMYKRAEGLFGMPMAVRQRNKKSPTEWWLAYGCSTPELQVFAVKVLSLTCSSSACERNWSVFEHVDMSLRLLKGGKHVLQEKPAAACSGLNSSSEFALCAVPLCLNSRTAVFYKVASAISELETAISCYNSFNVAPIWAIAENYRFEPAFVEGRKLLTEVGDIINVHTIIEGSMNISNPYFSSSWRRDFNGGFILDMGVHFIAGLRMLVGCEITSVSALTSHIDGTLPPPDHISSTIQLENGSSGVFVLVVSSKSPKVLWRVVGLKGTIQVERGDIDGKHGYAVTLFTGDGGNKSWFYPFSGVTDELKTFLADASLATLKKDQSYQVEQRLSFLEGARDVAVLEAMLESGKRQGAAVQVRKF